MRYVIFGLMALGLMVGAAIAQDTPAPPPSTVVDLSPIINSIAGFAIIVITGVLTWVGTAVRNWFAAKVDLSKTQLDEQIQQMYNESVARSMAYAESVIKGAMPKEIDTKSEFVSVAARYLVQMWPELTKGMDLDKIRDSIIARLPSGAATKTADAIVLAKAAGTVEVKT